MQDLASLQQRIGHFFHDPDLLRLALTHKSFAYEKRTAAHNERLEFLGDAVLNLAISEHLVKVCPDASEGLLSRFRAIVVSQPSLAAIARAIDLGPHLYLGRGEEQTGGRDKTSLLSNALEALIAALYLDAGQRIAALFIDRFFGEAIDSARGDRALLDYKTSLQELCQERLHTLPIYRVVIEAGPDHQKEFTVELVIQDTIHGRAVGRTKKEAEQRAAKEAFEKMLSV